MHFPHFSRKISLLLLTALLAAACGVMFAFTLAAGVRQTMSHSSTETSTRSEAYSAPSDVSSEPSDEPETSQTAKPIEKSLIITSPASLNTTVTEPKAVITGICDPKSPLEMNGKKVECDANGAFSVTVELSHGKNSFTFKHKDEALICSIRYRYVVINAYAPSASQSVDGGSTIVATVSARAGGTASATFNGQTVQLVRQGGEELAADEFCNFSAIFTVPAATSKDVNLGKITFTASYNGISESFSSGNIVCKKVYIPRIAEIVIHSAETFNGGSRDNWTRPTNNYLPEGTVDYVTGSFSAQDGSYVNNFLELKCGRRIYADQIITPGRSRVQVAKVYDGTLPDHNELSVAGVTQSEKYTTLTLNTLWKAPFFLDLLPQTYTNPAAQNYTVSSFTAKYVEIKFCYATVFEGEINISADNPLFSRSEIIRNADSTTVRLYFKKTGAFYGWDCSYNSAGQLVFEFRHPVKVSADSNEYGVNLTGVTILVDAGHGGIDPGAGSGAYEEESRNLYLANLIKNELAKTGATVIMTRTSDTTLNSLDRTKKYRSMKPDFMVSVHHDSSTSAGANGFGSFYTTPFSQSAAQKVFERTMNTGIYQNTSWTKLGWHHFYMTRMTYCPSVLTENGFVSSTYDQPGIADNTTNLRKAKAIAAGICDYFLSVG